MGKIIRNGIEYSGTSDSANNVNYDNSASGLNARTVQEGIDELNKGKLGAFPVDNLLSTATDIPLSANQGRVLDEKISTINESLKTTRYIDLQALKVDKKNGVVYLTFENGIAVSASAGNIGGLSDADLFPKQSEYFPVSNGKIVAINKDGLISLYSNDLTQFATGTFFGSFSYLAK